MDEEEKTKRKWKERINGEQWIDARKMWRKRRIEKKELI